MNYRRDIDGLRAIAVVSVVAYHAVEAWMPGGYVGVDVFFVISGYLITRLLLKDLRLGSFSIAHFYLRRSRRILPALFVCAAASTGLAAFLLSPKQLNAYAASLSATFAFVSNLLFWRSADYFNARSETTPLLHTWSLAVEEQFYLLWPLTVSLLAKCRHRAWWVGGAVVASFVLSVVAVTLEPSAAFYLLPSRGWELLVGAAIAVAAGRHDIPRSWRTTLAVLGLAMICVSLVLLDRSSPFPGWNALLPCVGAGLLILAGEGVSNPVSERVLGWRPMVFVGLISYSLYLWHWPLLALARITQHGVLTGLQLSVVLTVVGLVAVASWRVVEVPFRHASDAVNRRPLFVYLALSAAFVSAGFALPGALALVSAPSSSIGRIQAAADDVNPRQGKCLRNQGQFGPLSIRECVNGSGRAALVVWGDSHASALVPGFDRLAADRDVASYQLTMIACPPLLDVEVRQQSRAYTNCNDFNRMVIDFIESTPSVSTVVLAARWSLYDGSPRFGPDDQGEPMSIERRSGNAALTGEPRPYTAGLRNTLRRLRSAGREVILVGSVPPMGINVPDCLVRNHMPWSSVSSCDQDAGVVLPLLRAVDSTLADVGRQFDGVCTYLPASDLCASGRCVSRAGDAILYADDDHLTSSGAALVVRRLGSAGCEVGR